MVLGLVKTALYKTRNTNDCTGTIVHALH